MKNLRKIGMCIFVFIITFLLGFVGGNTYNFYNSNYEIVFSVNAEFDYEKLVNQEYLLTIANSAKKYENIDIEKIIKNNDLKIEKNNNKYIITTGYQYYAEFFNSKSQTKGTRVKQFYIDAIDGLVGENEVTYQYDNVYVVKGSINRYIVASITGIIGLIGVILYYMYNKEDNRFEYDNINTFQTPFHKTYWKESLVFLDSTKKIVTLAMLFSLMMVCKLFSLPSGFSNLGISLTYLFFALISLIYGPIAGFTVGLLSDVLGFFLFDRSGLSFNFLYTIQAMMAGFVYGLCLFKTKISFTRCFISRLIVNLILNVVWGSFCFGFVMNWNKEVIIKYALIMELPKNIIYLVPQTLLLFVFLKFISPILYQNKYISKMIYENVKK